jgi:HAD superfamily hydrolase (TIGR01509 family)
MAPLETMFRLELAHGIRVGEDAAMKNRLPPGKVPWEIVADLLSGELPAEVKLGPAAGEDAALVEIGGELWAVASDPVSFTASDAGRLAVIINANDVAVRGARPRFFLAVGLIAPHEASEERVQELLSQVRDTCDEVGCALIGGHTEVTPGLPHSMVVGTMFGPVEGDPLTTGGLREGDLVGMTRSAGLEGTAILLKEYGDRLRELHETEDFARADEILAGDWLLVAPQALRAAACAGVTALHDVTEGGIGEALHEMAVASGLAIETRREAIPVLTETGVICGDLGIDPLGLIGSGSLLVGCTDAGRHELETAFVEIGVPFSWIGRAVAAEGPAQSSLPRFPRDELLKTAVMDGVRAVVFDMDGTLIDSSYDWPEIRRRLGVSGSSIIDDLNGLAEPERSRRWAELEAIESAATAEARLHDGVADLLELLAAKGLKTALVTNNSGANTQALLDRFGLVFGIVLTRDSGLWKPSGAPISEAVSRLGVAPGHCLGVGDSRYDVIAARAAGLAAVCVLHDGTGRHGNDAELEFDDIPAFVRYLRIVLHSRNKIPDARCIER